MERTPLIVRSECVFRQCLTPGGIIKQLVKTWVLIVNPIYRDICYSMGEDTEEWYAKKLVQWVTIRNLRELDFNFLLQVYSTTILKSAVWSVSVQHKTADVGFPNNKICKCLSYLTTLRYKSDECWQKMETLNKLPKGNQNDSNRFSFW